MIKAEAENQQQIEFWNGARGETWAAEQEALDRALAPFGEAVLRAAAAVVGESVVDIGCGCGASTLALADLVGASGRVHGVDVSAPMLARARQRASGRSEIHFTEADASRFAFLAEASLLHSRFGVMFFDQPERAFAHLTGALRDGGRVAFVCWRGLADNPWLAIPLAVARTLLPSAPLPHPNAPGPLAFGDPDRVRAILKGASLVDVTCTPFDHPMPLGDGSGLASVIEDAMTRGPIVRLLDGVADEMREMVRGALAEALTPELRDNTVTLDGGAWIVTARKPLPK